MKKIIWILFAILFGVDTGGYCQQSVLNLQKEITAGYKKAYPACVKLYAFDTVTRQQAGGQFSGVVVTRDGYILTAAHVETPGKVYKVMFPDGKSSLATGLGKIEFAEDKTRPDAAMLKMIDGNDWPFASIANSDDLKVDEPCLSISYPETLNQPKPTLRLGYVAEVKNERGFIKSTCIMEPGDSGGPLFDYLGRVIGIHSAIEIPEADNYDVPANVFLKYWSSLIKPTIYTSLPAVADNIPNDPAATGLMTVPGQYSNAVFSPAKHSFNNDCYFVKSTLNGKPQLATATLFRWQGKYILVSKNSLVGDAPAIISKDAKPVTSVVIARDKSTDLVMLAIPVKLPGGISIPEKCTDTVVINVGTILMSTCPDSLPVISVLGSEILKLPKMTSAAFLGVGFKSKTAPLKIAYVFPNLNKSICQLHIGDEIRMLGSDTLTGFESFLDKINKYWPGDTVKLSVKHNDTIAEKMIVLDTIPQRHFDHPAEKFAGGKSVRRDGLDKVFTHDAILKPSQCGGPVFDAWGNFCGLNIARYSRTTVIAEPASVIYDFIQRSLNNGKTLNTLNQL